MGCRPLRGQKTKTTMNLVVQKPRKYFLTDTELATKSLFISRKYRGHTGVVVAEGGRISVHSGNAVSEYNLPHLNFHKDGIYIGEIYTPRQEDENNLQNALNLGDFDQIHFAVYDILKYGTNDLMDMPLRDRLPYLNEIEGKYIHRVEETSLRTRSEIMREILEKGWEGVVAADLGAKHVLNFASNGVRRRGESWKLKPAYSLEFEIVRKEPNGVVTAIQPMAKSIREHKFGSFEASVDQDNLRIGDIIEVSFCSIDKGGNLVHPVVKTIRTRACV